MVLNRKKSKIKKINLGKGFGLFIAVVLVFSTLAMLIDVQPAEAASDTYNEDFITTTYMDSSNTNATGWGSGTINLPRKTPTLAGSCDTPDHAHDVFVSGDYAYVADDYSGLQVIDISDPENPTLVSSYDTDRATGVFVSSDYAYVAD